MARRTSKSLTRSPPPDEALCGPAGHQGTRESRCIPCRVAGAYDGWWVFGLLPISQRDFVRVICYGGRAEGGVAGKRPFCSTHSVEESA